MSARGHHYGNSCSSQSTVGFSTAPTSVPGTPNRDTEVFEFNVRLRALGNEANSHAVVGPTTIALPADLRSGVKEAKGENPGDILNRTSTECRSQPKVGGSQRQQRENFDFWGELPPEIRVTILQFLKPKQIVQCSAVSKSWHNMCFDGQLWINMDVQKYYRDIPSASLVKIMTAAGPFVRALNLRGCVQMPERWGTDGQKISEACGNLERFILEGCQIDRSSVHWFLLRNPRLVHLDVSTLTDLNNSTMKMIAQNCPQLEHLNVSWCLNFDTKGLRKIVRSCPRLRDLRAAGIKGFDDQEFLLDLFTRNTLEQLVVSRCQDFNDDSLRVLVQGVEPETDPLTGRAVVPPRKFRHLNLSSCSRLTDRGVRSLAHHVPQLASLQLAHCQGLTDESLVGILESTPSLTHLDLEELDDLSNATLQTLSRAGCASTLQYLNISYCESLGDSGMLAVLKKCSRLRQVVMDNTRVSDLALTEAAAQLRLRDRGFPSSSSFPAVGLRLVVYDCQNVTWTGVREVLSRNTDPQRGQIISLKCFHLYQPTVDEHTKRVLRGDLQGAMRLEHKWGELMLASEEAGAGGGRRRRRRLREAAMVHADEEEGGPRGGRRRARSGGCAVM